MLQHPLRVDFQVESNPSLGNQSDTHGRRRLSVVTNVLLDWKQLWWSPKLLRPRHKEDDPHPCQELRAIRQELDQHRASWGPQTSHYQARKRRIPR
jgi:hypothetical protein